MNCLIRIILGLLLALLVLTGLLFAFFALISTGRIRPYMENGKPLENSISEKTIVEINGAKNGFIIRGKNLDNPVLLFVSSGPGSSDYFYNEKYPGMNLDDYFTVCYWDYRGMCMVYDKNLDPETITTSQINEDTKAVTEYLMNRFGKDKIFIMGFSGGTNIALQAVYLYPQYYYAYFSMAQVVCSNEDNDTYIYDFMKKVFEERKDTRRLKKLEKEVIHLDSGKVKCRNWPSYVYLLHQAGGGTIKNKSEFTGIDIPIFMSHCYTLKEKLDYVPGLKMYRETPFCQDNKLTDYRQKITSLDVPVYFISGDYDYNCPWPLVKEYCELLEAPDKDFLLVPDAAHSPLWENHVPVIEYMKSKKDMACNFRK